jgi:glycosyltransferase involved in cell wall biosynthesis
MTALRLAMVSPGYPPAMGGVEMVTAELCRRLSRMPDVEVEAWVADWSAPTPMTESIDGVLVRRFPAWGTRQFAISTSLLRHIRRHGSEFHLLHTHNYHSAVGVGGVLLAGATPVVMSLHYHGGGHTPAARTLHVAYRPLARRALPAARALIAVSAAERILIERDFPELSTRVRVIHNAVDVETIRAAQPYPDQPPTVLVLGRLEPYKRVDSVIDAFGLLSGHAQLVVLGQGPALETARAAAARSPRAADITLLGFVESTAKDRWLKTAAVVVSASEKEAFGLGVMEGVAAGAQVVLSDIPAHRELASVAPPGAVSLLPPARGAQAMADLAAVLGQALAVPRSPGRSVRDWQDVADEHLALYRRVLGE